MKIAIEIQTLWYSEEDNRLIDEDGNIFYDIFRIISPGEYMWFKSKRGTYYIPSKENKDLVYELMFPLDWELYEI